jgi:predicted Zn finger-like uncharacterized protein
MIIQCRKCETKFRFDENLIAKEGGWVRCSRCRHVFYQDAVGDRIAPQEVQPEAERMQDTIGPEEKGGRDISDVAAGMAGSGADIKPEKERDEAIFSRAKEIREAMEEKDIEYAVKEFDDLEDLTEGKSETEPAEEIQEAPAGVIKKKRGFWGRTFAFLFILLFITLLLGGLYLWVFPQARQQAMDILSPYCPLIERLGKDRGRQDQVAGRVALQDIRQHFVNNWLMGNLRIVEGTAVNTEKYPLTRIQVRGRLYNKEGVLLTEKVSFCGNLLTDAELATLTEEEFQRKLTQPQGSNVSNERISSRGQIPFTIIFAYHDQPSVAKTTVMVSGAEKLLE